MFPKNPVSKKEIFKILITFPDLKFWEWKNSVITIGGNGKLSTRVQRRLRKFTRKFKLNNSSLLWSVMLYVTSNNLKLYIISMKGNKAKESDKEAIRFVDRQLLLQEIPWIREQVIPKIKELSLVLLANLCQLVLVHLDRCHCLSLVAYYYVI